MNKSVFKKTLITLAIIMSCFLISSCSKDNNSSNKNENNNQSSVDDSSSNIQDDIVDQIVPLQLPNGMDVDTLSYVYSSIVVDLLSLGYDVFDAIATTEKGNEAGLAYCDFEEVYEFAGNNKKFIPTGFLSFSPNYSINSHKEMVYITPIDENATKINDDYYGYFASITEDGLPDGHLIANNKYVKYSVDDSTVNIQTFSNSSENYDLSRGKLFNYDNNELVFIPYDEISSDPIEYVPLTEKIDGEKIKSNLYSIIEEQEKNGYNIESVTISHISLDALNSLKGILSQGNLLNGYSFEELNNIDIDNSTEYIHFNEDGSITIKDLPPMPADSKMLFDWIVDGLVLTGAASLCILSTVFLGPAGTVISAGILGAGIEYFDQTIIQGNKISNVNWGKVGILALSGVLSSVAPCAGTLGYLAAGTIGGLTSAALTAIDGGSTKEILESAAKGAFTGLLTHGLFSSCFPAGTPVLTKDGLIPIESIEVGTLVASYNIYSNKIEWNPVLDTYCNQSCNFTEIKLSDGSKITSTANHPYFQANKNTYTAANHLNVGDMLLNSYGLKSFITSIQNYTLTESINVYNLNVDNNHNYFVGEGYLVHNSCAHSSNEWKKIKKNYWESVADKPSNSTYYSLTKQNAELMKRGRAPIGTDGYKVELHHITGISDDITNFIPMSKTAHTNFHVKYGYKNFIDIRLTEFFK